MKAKFTRFASLLLVVVVLFGAAGVPPATAQEDIFRLTVLHTNDTHSWHLPASGGNGGVARQAAVASQIRAEGGNVLTVDAGDRFTGTLFHRVHQGQDNAQVMMALGYQAMALGNHEFDNGLEVLVNFINAVDFPVLAANLDVTNSPELRDLVRPSVTVEVGGQQIGLIGLITGDTPEITINFPGKENLIWSTDYAAVVQAQVDALTAQGVNKIIVLSHIGFGGDQALASGTTGVDVIIGGHSHTTLSNIYREGVEAYPIRVENPDGAAVYIVQTGDRNRYLGRLDLEFDAEGVVTRAAGDLIMLARYITPDPTVQALVDTLAVPVNELAGTPIFTAAGVEAVTDVELSNAECRIVECALGNVVADALRWETGAQIAITNGGGLRAPIDIGPISVGEVIAVLPFGNTVATMEVTGADIIAALENGVSRVGGTSGTGRFPQISGVRFTFDAALEAGSRIDPATIEVEIAPGEFAPIDPAATYKVATNNFTRTGGDGYTMFAENAINPYDFGRPLDQVVIDYIALISPVTAQPEDRIVTLNRPQ